MHTFLKYVFSSNFSNFWDPKFTEKIFKKFKKYLISLNFSNEENPMQKILKNVFRAIKIPKKKFKNNNHY
jgi:hypothetical protein